MRAYRFTTHKEPELNDTVEPAEFESDSEASKDAQRALAELAADALPDGDHQEFYVAVHDSDGVEIYRATMTFDARYP